MIPTDSIYSCNVTSLFYFSDALDCSIPRIVQGEPFQLLDCTTFHRSMVTSWYETIDLPLPVFQSLRLTPCGSLDYKSL